MLTVSDAINSNIQNKNLLTMLRLQPLAILLVSNIGKYSFQQYSCNMRKKNMNHCHMIHVEKLQQQKYMVETLFQGKEM